MIAKVKDIAKTKYEQQQVRPRKGLSRRYMDTKRDDGKKSRERNNNKKKQMDEEEEIGARDADNNKNMNDRKGMEGRHVDEDICENWNGKSMSGVNDKITHGNEASAYQERNE